MALALKEDWRSVLLAAGALDQAERLAERAEQERARGTAVAPGGADVFRALNTTPLRDVRVVILGQDPYPTPGHADGLCFSVRPCVAPPRSLKNIFKEMSSDLGLPEATNGSLTHWAEQGVLLLNTVLTVEEGSANSHHKWGWQAVTDAVIAAVAASPAPVVYILWGRHAQAKTGLIDTNRHLVLASAHPSPLSARRGFFGSRPFSRANEWLEAQGQPGIDWELPKAA